jgi:polygalacturonase
MAWPSAIVNIIGEENASVTGEGVIDGDGKYLWDTYWEMRRDYEKRGLRWIVDYDCKRVRSLLVSNSRNITLRGLTFQRSGFWTIQVLYSSYCTASGITIRNNLGGQGPSTDGIDIDSSHHILVEKCDIDCNDDNICLKAGRDADGLRVNRPTEYVLIRQCTARRGAGLMTCGSETSGSIRHIWCCDSRALGTSAVMRIKSAATRGGVVEYIGMSNVRADSVRFILHCDMNWNPLYSYSTLPPAYEGRELPAHWQVMLKEVPSGQAMPIFRHITLSGIKGRNTGAFIQCTGHPQSVIDTVELEDIDVESQFASTISHTRILHMKKVRQLIIDN